MISSEWKRLDRQLLTPDAGVGLLGGLPEKGIAKDYRVFARFCGIDDPLRRRRRHGREDRLDRLYSNWLVAEVELGKLSCWAERGR